MLSATGRGLGLSNPLTKAAPFVFTSVLLRLRSCSLACARLLLSSAKDGAAVCRGLVVIGLTGSRGCSIMSPDNIIFSVDVEILGAELSTGIFETVAILGAELSRDTLVTLTTLGAELSTGIFETVATLGAELSTGTFETVAILGAELSTDTLGVDLFTTTLETLAT